MKLIVGKIQLHQPTDSCEPSDAATSTTQYRGWKRWKRKIEGVISMQKEWLLKEATAIAENHPSKDARAFAFAVADFLREDCKCNKSDAMDQLEDEG